MATTVPPVPTNKALGNTARSLSLGVTAKADRAGASTLSFRFANASFIGRSLHLRGCEWLIRASKPVQAFPDPRFIRCQPSGLDTCLVSREPCLHVAA